MVPTALFLLGGLLIFAKGAALAPFIYRLSQERGCDALGAERATGRRRHLVDSLNLLPAIFTPAPYES